MIADRQNAPEILALVRAMTSAHAQVQRLEGGRLAISVLVALSSVLAAVAPGLATVVAALGAGWALLNGLAISAWIQAGTARAALMQELFDVTLFRMEWNAVAAGDSPSAAEVSRFARRYQGPDDVIIDYYEIRDFRDLPPPFDVLACQIQNLHWGTRIRRRFAGLVLALVIGWPVAGVIVGVLLRTPLDRLLLIWFLPALGALLMASELYRRQRDIAASRTRVLGLVQRRIADHLARPGPPDGLLALARQVQDSILASRRAQARVPDWFFRRFRPQDRLDFQREMTELAASVARVYPPTAPPPPPSP
ncbi:S-4TM family putative pore-forming effector [Actinoplanes sp. HUAS TT8]|uniref:S-4TM family putative pore-forming effector n=1 Tax=Actinoplanes sp. HUAS TT8 TaxID=3447453 RepID=UPI003F520137